MIVLVNFCKNIRKFIGVILFRDYLVWKRNNINIIILFIYVIYIFIEMDLFGVLVKYVDFWFLFEVW